MKLPLRLPKRATMAEADDDIGGGESDVDALCRSWTCPRRAEAIVSLLPCWSLPIYMKENIK